MKRTVIKIHPLDKYIENIFPVDFAGKGVYCSVYNFGAEITFSVSYKRNYSHIEMNKWYECTLKNGTVGYFYLKLEKVDGRSPEKWPPLGDRYVPGKIIETFAYKNCFIEIDPSINALKQSYTTRIKDNNLLFTTFLERVKKSGFCETDFVALSKSYSLDETTLHISGNGTYDPFKYDSLESRGAMHLLFSENLIPKIGEPHEIDLIDSNEEKEMLPSKLFTFLCPLKTKILDKEIIADKKAVYEFRSYGLKINGEDYYDSKNLHVYSFQNKVTGYEICHFLYNQNTQIPIPGEYNKCEINKNGHYERKTMKIGDNLRLIDSDEVHFYKRQRDNPKAVCGWEPLDGEKLYVEYDDRKKWFRYKELK